MEKKKSVLAGFKWRWEYFLVILLIAEFIIFGGLNPRFLNPFILMNSINNFIPVCIVSLFVTYVIITGGILIAIVVIGAISNQRSQENIRKERLRVRVEQGGE